MFFVVITKGNQSTSILQCSNINDFYRQIDDLYKFYGCEFKNNSVCIYDVISINNKLFYRADFYTQSANWSATYISKIDAYNAALQFGHDDYFIFSSVSDAVDFHFEFKEELKQKSDSKEKLEKIYTYGDLYNMDGEDPLPYTPCYKELAWRR